MWKTCERSSRMTTAPRLGMRSIRPRCSSAASASRMRVRGTPNSSARSCSRSLEPGGMSWRAMRSRSVATMWATLGGCFAVRGGRRAAGGARAGLRVSMRLWRPRLLRGMPDANGFVAKVSTLLFTKQSGGRPFPSPARAATMGALHEADTGVGIGGGTRGEGLAGKGGRASSPPTACRARKARRCSTSSPGCSATSTHAHLSLSPAAWACAAPAP